MVVTQLTDEEFRADTFEYRHATSARRAELEEKWGPRSGYFRASRDLAPPKFPDDFQILVSEDGGSYWHWHPDTPPDYDGFWDEREDPPPWIGGLIISDETTARAEFGTEPGTVMVVSWEYGPELESGPYRHSAPSDGSIQSAVDEVIADVNEERTMSSRGVVSGA